jgi:fructokinase
MAEAPYRDRRAVTSWGELLWDLFDDGPELGGAPANFAAHLAKLGRTARLVTQVGNDSWGRKAIAQMVQLGVEVILPTVRAAHPTGQVSVSMQAGEPQFAIAPHSAWDELTFSDEALREIAATECLCFGTLALRRAPNRSTLRRLLGLEAQRPPGERALRIVDLNLRPPFVAPEAIALALSAADVLKVNRDELAFLGRHLDVRDPVNQLFETTAIQMILVSLGKDGAEARTRHLRVVSPAFPSLGNHPVGAGDAFLAGFTAKFLDGERLPRSLEFGVRYASWVSERPGAIPEGLPLWLHRSTAASSA